MSAKDLFNSYTQLLAGIDSCIKESLIVPALVLIYSGIDSVGWLASDNENEAVATSFQNWVNKWMLKKYPLPCTALELYAARCGILHTLSANSALTDKKNVRRIAYAWGTAKVADLEETIRRIQYPQLVVLHVNDISLSFHGGLIDFMESLQTDDAKRELFAEKAAKHFAYAESSEIAEFLASSAKSEG